MKKASQPLRPMSFVKQIGKDLKNDQKEQENMRSQFQKEWKKWGTALKSQD